MRKILLSLMLVVGLSVVALAANQNLTDKSEGTSPTNDDLIYVVDDPSGTPADKKVTLQNVPKAWTNHEILADGINWDGLQLNRQYVNWTLIEDIKSAGINWDDILKTTPITEGMIQDLQAYLTSETDPVFGAWNGSDGINWGAMPELAAAGINWDDVKENELGVNWVDVFDFSTAADVNWSDMPLIENDGINWLSIESITLDGDPQYFQALNATNPASGTAEGMFAGQGSDHSPYYNDGTAWRRILTANQDINWESTSLIAGTKCINIDPSATETDWLFLWSPKASTIYGGWTLAEGSTSIVLTPKECDGNGANCSALADPITVTATGAAVTFTDTAIAAGHTIRVERGTVTGSPTQAFFCATLY